MRFSSSSLQLLAVATTDTTMSYSRASYRGRNSWRRGFSDRPNGGWDEFVVSGESHIRSVGDANYTYRQVEGQNFPNSGGFQRQPPYRQPQQPPFHQPQFSHQPPPFQQPPQYFHQQQQFRQVPPPFYPPPHFEQQPSFQQPPNFGQPPPQFLQPQYSHQQQPFRPPPPFYQRRPIRPPNSKPRDFRNWEYALSQLPSHCERFIVLSYNILADYLAINHRRELYSHIPGHILDWEWRKRKILTELRLWSPDIMCLQEVDRFQDLEEELKLSGYSGIWKMRTGIPTDGCAILWRTTRFKLIHEESIEYNKLGLRDNVAQICVLESRNQNCADTGSDALPQSSNGVNQVVICNIHVLYNPRRGEIKLGQVRVLLERAHAVSKLWNDAPVVICGDFNCTPKSPLYNFISEQKLDLTGLARDKMSGQHSAQIYTSRPYNPNPGPASFRAQAPYNLNQASIVGEEKEAGEKPSDCTQGIHNLNEPNAVDRALFTNNLHQPQSDTDMGCISHKSSDVHYRKEDTAISDESSKERQHEPIESDKTSPNSFVPVELIAVDSRSDGVQDLISPSTPFESSNPPLVENGYGYQSSDSPDCSLPETLTQRSQSDSHVSGLIDSSMQEGLVHADMDTGTPDMKEDVTSFESNVYHTESRHDETLENAFVQDGTSELVSEAPFADDSDVSLSESLGNLASELITGEEKANPSSSNQSVDVSTCVDFNDDHKLPPLSKLDEFTEQNGSLGQASISTLSSEAHTIEDTFQSDVDHDCKSVRPGSGETDQSSENLAISPQKLQVPAPFDEIQGEASLSIDPDLTVRKENIYDPSSWTPMEIETASGSADCTLIEHPLKLRSTYAEVEDYSGTRDSSREPLVTSYNRRFMGTVDYIWCSEGLQTVKVLDTIPKHALKWTPGFPTPKWGSDHIALASQLAFTKDKDRS